MCTKQSGNYIFISTNRQLLVTLITGLIIAGLVIDLGGGPDHDRIGFRVSASLVSRFNND